MAKKFYDVHMHMFDLSHPNLLAFIGRFFDNPFVNWLYKYFKRKNKKLLPIILAAFLILLLVFFLYFISGLYIKQYLCESGLYSGKSIIWLVLSAAWFLALTGGLIWCVFVSRKLNIYDKINSALNCLAVMENPVERQFLLLEHFLKDRERNGSYPLIVDNQLKIGKNSYDKMVICPLIMDFGMRNINMDFDKNPNTRNIFYNIAPQKPVVKQVEDLLNASKTYYNKASYNDWNTMKRRDELIAQKLFEIYPFIGLNTCNYIIQDLEEMFERYFSGYENDTKPIRLNKMRENLGKFGGNIYNKEEEMVYYFAGIKVYPPLGFNPMPSNNDEKEKVDFLYKTASDKRIPIITHCSDGGFKTVEDAKELTDPSMAWSRVLEAYPKLKLCFAHFGHQQELGKTKKDWQKTIIKLITAKNQDGDYKYPNVYTDISCCKGDKNYYDNLYQLIKKEPELQKRILFGSDFSINLFTGEKSYNSYLKKFSKHFDNEFTDLLCSENPERFLFGV